MKRNMMVNRFKISTDIHSFCDKYQVIFRFRKVLIGALNLFLSDVDAVPRLSNSLLKPQPFSDFYLHMKSTTIHYDCMST